MVINRLVLLILVYLAAACAPIGHVDPRPIRSTDVEFKPYVADFEANYNVVVTTPIGFVDSFKDDVGGNKIGTCTRRVVTSSKTIVYKYISIKRSYWEEATDVSRLALIYHELIHCELGVKGHIDDRHEDDCATNFMNTFLPSAYCLDKYIDSYVKYWQ